MDTNHKSQNIRHEESKITRVEREGRINQKAATLWMTGLSGSGKSTIARALERRLFDAGHRVYWMDGDNVRFGLNRDLGFSKEDRAENIRRVAEVAQLFNDAGLIVIASFISPYREDRIRASESIGNEHFVEVYVSTPLEVCEERDIKGLYAKARAGEIQGFTGVNDPYEVPQKAKVTLDSSDHGVDACVDILCKYLEENHVIDASPSG